MNTLLPLALVLALPGGPSATHGSADGDFAPLTVGPHVFHRRELENGLRAVAVRDEEEHVSVFLVVGVGNRQETPETTGLAHLVEHAMFSGTPTTGTDQHERIVVSWGGSSNAYTRQDYTLYYDHGFAPEHLAGVLSMEADRLRNLGFYEEAFLDERQRLTDEEAYTYQPSEGRMERIEGAVYRVHPYRVGLRDENGHTRAPELSIEQVKAFYDRYYHPNNVCVVVAGPIEEQVALDAVEAAFGEIPRGPLLSAPPLEPWLEKARTEVLSSSLPRDRYDLVWLMPEMGDSSRPTLELLASWIDRRELPGERPIEVSLGGRVDREMLRISATGEDALEGLRRIVKEVRATAPPAEELEEVKRLQADQFESRPLRARPYFALAGTFAVHEVVGHAEVLSGHRAAIEAVMPEDLQAAAVRYLVPEHCITVYLKGTGEEVAPLPADPAELQTAAMEAADAGDYSRAIEAYTRLLADKPNRMNTVIFLATRGQLYLERRDYDSAIADFEEALAVVDYPAVRDLLDEALVRKEAAMRGKLGGEKKKGSSEQEQGEKK